MHTELIERIEDEILNQLGYKITPDVATELAESIVEILAEIIEERLKY